MSVQRKVIQPLLGQLMALSPEQRRAVLEQARQRGAGSTAIPRLHRLSRDGSFSPASPGQGRLWFLWRLEPRSGTYHVSWCYEVSGGLEVRRLAVAVDALIARHAVLRTTLHERDERDGQIMARVGPPWQCDLVAVQAIGGNAIELATAAAREPFDLSAGPLLRVRAWQLAADRHLVAFTAHHVVLDGWSLEVFERELWALYQADGDPAAAGLSALEIQYADYAAWHRDLTASRASDDLTWWRRMLDGAIPVCPAPDRPAAEYTELAGDQAVVTMPASALDWLDATRAASGTDFVALLAVWCLFLARQTGRRDLTVGTLVSGRSHPDTAALIGFLVNTLALRVRVDPSGDFPGYLRSVRAVVLDAFAHQEVPFDHVVRAVTPCRDLARNPLFNTLFSYLPAEAADLRSRTLAGGLKVTVPVTGTGSHSASQRTARPRYLPLDLSLTAARSPEGLALQLEYSTDRYDRASITGYLESFRGLLDAVNRDPATPLRALLGDEPPPADEPSGDGALAHAEYVPPATATERRIARLWAGVLGLGSAELSVSADFFAIGGYSLLALRLAARLGAELRIDFPVQQIFATPTIAGQAAYADEVRKLTLGRSSMAW